LLTCSLVKKNLKRVESDLMWPNQLYGSKNKRTTIKIIVWLKRFQDDIFLKYWYKNILDRPMSTRVNLLNPQPGSCDRDNSIESKLKKL
jgi:hypothetical protein